MTIVILANGQSVRAMVEPAEFGALLAAAQPSSWITVTVDTIGPVQLNSFVIAYYYGDGDE